MTQLDYTFDRQILLERRDAREEGREEGRAEGIQLTKKVLKLDAEGKSIDDIAFALNVNREVVREILE